MRRELTMCLLIVAMHERVSAEPDRCHMIEVELDPTPDLQIAVWLEDAAGTYVDTLYLTQATGLRGIGNRPGVMDMPSGPLWLYGARLSVLPVWGHAHGLTFPTVTFQSGSDTPDSSAGGIDANIGGAFSQFSSREPYFNPPMGPTDPRWDRELATSETVFSDKGRMSSSATRVYPPRADHVRDALTDAEDVDAYPAMNPFDAISRATPNAPVLITRRLLDAVEGVYVVRVEANKERDFNSAFYEARFPRASQQWSTLGVAYRGQPSVVYETTIAVGPTDSTASTSTYAGYGSIDGADGDVRPPDDTITSDVPGSGGRRIANVRVQSRVLDDVAVPSAASDLAVTVYSKSIELSFVEPGDDGDIGTVSRFDVRYRIGSEMDDTSFESATPLPFEMIEALVPEGSGHRWKFIIDDLLPGTPYVLGIRAFDDCDRAGRLAVIAFETERQDGEVSACGCSAKGAGSSGLVVGLGFMISRGWRQRRRK